MSRNYPRRRTELYRFTFGWFYDRMGIIAILKRVDFLEF